MKLDARWEQEPWAGVLRRHGGLARWRLLAGVELRCTKLVGLVPWMKGVGSYAPTPARVTVEPARRRVVFHDYPGPGSRVVFDRGAVWRGDADAPAPASGGDHRGRFVGVQRLRRWTPEDVGYFFGYALSHYLGLPFSLARLSPARCSLTRRAGRALPMVATARYAPRDHTHGRVERFYFDRDGLLRRHDYVAEIIGRAAAGAHFSDDYARVDGWPIARRRVVRARLGPVCSPLVVLDATLEPLAVTWSSAPSPIEDV